MLVTAAREHAGRLVVPTLHGAKIPVRIVDRTLEALKDWTQNERSAAAVAVRKHLADAVRHPTSRTRAQYLTRAGVVTIVERAMRH